MGRTKGSKNKRENHKAGGDRRSARFKKKQKTGSKESPESFFAKRRQNDSMKSTPQRTPHPMEEKTFKQSQALMAKVLDHESMPKGKFAPNKGFVDTAACSNNWEIEYDETEEKANGSTKCTRRSYQPRLHTPPFEYK